MAKLGVNIDHAATLRQARRGKEPDPVWVAGLAEIGGADGITVHLREDRRHIQDRDVRLLRQTTQVKLNLEMAATDAMIAFALEVKPEQVTLVPEKREEITTEGGLDVAGALDRLRAATARMQDAGMEVSMFIDPDPRQVDASHQTGARAVELHTGRYAEAFERGAKAKELEALRRAGALTTQLGMILHLGHGLNYVNVADAASLPHVDELNIGHSIISRALFVGVVEAVREMKRLIS